MMTERPHYRAYLLRLWQVRDNEKVIWRASLEDPHTGTRRGFASLEMMLAFLREQTHTPTQSQEQVEKISQ